MVIHFTIGSNLTDVSFLMVKTHALQAASAKKLRK